MKQPFIFVSCGQYTPEEKSLGKAIVEMVRSVTSLDAFYAEEVHDLNGLDSNILGALRECAAFIAVMHPRGTITRPDGSSHVRASVWIEQEIAIATYVQRSENRLVPVIAFIHESVDREGIRELVHLNPTPFTRDREVLDVLAERLRALGPLDSSHSPDLEKTFPAIRQLKEHMEAYITPMVPSGHERDIFRVRSVFAGDGSVIVEYATSSQQLALPLNRIDVLSNGPGMPRTIHLNGRLQLMTTGHRDQWKFFPETSASSLGNPKLEQIRANIGKNVTVFNRQKYGQKYLEGCWANGGIVSGCNELWVELIDPTTNIKQSFALDSVTITFDDAKNRLRLTVER